MVAAVLQNLIMIFLHLDLFKNLGRITKLTNQAPTSGAQRYSYSHLLFPHGCARKLQVGHVGASDQENEADGSEQNQQQPFDTAC